MLARETLAFLATFDWSAVVVALITLIGVLGVAAMNMYVVMQLRTPSGKRIGAQVEDVNHTSRITHHRVEALAKRVQTIDGESEG